MIFFGIIGGIFTTNKVTHSLEPAFLDYYEFLLDFITYFKNLLSGSLDLILPSVPYSDSESKSTIKRNYFIKRIKNAVCVEKNSPSTTVSVKYRKIHEVFIMEINMNQDNHD